MRLREFLRVFVALRPTTKLAPVLPRWALVQKHTTPEYARKHRADQIIPPIASFPVKSVLWFRPRGAEGVAADDALGGMINP